MTPKEYLIFAEEQEARIDAIRREISRAYAAVELLDPPPNLRPALASDIVPGAVIWYPNRDKDFSKWEAVDEIRDPGSDYKAFISGGARYGLSGAFVEAEEPQEPEGSKGSAE